MSVNLEPADCEGYQMFDDCVLSVRVGCPNSPPYCPRIKFNRAIFSADCRSV
jgi:hypothetical protein